MITVMLYDANELRIASHTVPSLSKADPDVFVGVITNGRINWDEGAIVNLVVGDQFDKEGRPINGVPIEQWVRNHGKNRARRVEVVIRDAMLEEGPASGGASEPPSGGASEPPSGEASGADWTHAREGQVGTSAGTQGGQAKISSASGNGPYIENAEAGPTSEGRHTRTTGEDNQGQPHGTKEGHERGRNPTGHTKGGRDGKLDGNKQEVGWFYDPSKSGRGDADVPTEGGQAGGLAGGEGRRLGGVPGGGAVIPVISMSREAAAAMSITMAIMDVNIVNVSGRLVALGKKLGKQGTTAASDALKAAVRKEIDGFADTTCEATVARLKASDPNFLARSAAEQEELVKDLREAIALDAQAKIAQQLDRRIDEVEAYVRRAKENPPPREYRNIVEEELAELEALKRTKDALPPKASSSSKSGTSAQTAAPEQTQVQPTSPTGIELRPEASYLKGKKHGLTWKEGPATAKSTGKPQGQWGSQADLDFAAEKAATLKPGEGAFFTLPPGSQSVVHLPDGTTVPATRIWVRNNGTGTFHGAPWQ